MKIIESWLREWINPPLTIKQIADQLTTAGFEVTDIHKANANFSGVVIGEIVAITSHPNAERLRICEVTVQIQSPHGSPGDINVVTNTKNTSLANIPSPPHSIATLSLSSSLPTTLTIVCGAQNARLGLKVPVALIGAKLPSDIKIQKTKLRGIESYGMLCSAKELQIPQVTEVTGLLELPTTAPIGMDLRDYLNLNDSVIEIELTANRGDCLSMLGIAREVAALNHLTLSKLEEMQIHLGKIGQTKKMLNDDISTQLRNHNDNNHQCNTPHLPKITLLAPSACSNYAACVIEGINNKVALPLWLKDRLEKSGLRSINPVVDITNYVMLELGQPLHAFAYHKIDGDIVVRYANSKTTCIEKTDINEINYANSAVSNEPNSNKESIEYLVLLDGKQLSLTHPNTLVIADNTQPIALAGIMGGTNTAVDENTTTIFLESAYFAPETIRQTARHYGLQTDAAYRFERGIDPTIQMFALNRARDLLLNIVGGHATPITTKSAEQHQLTTKAIPLSLVRVNRFLGTTLTPHIITNILLSLGMHIEEIHNDKYLNLNTDLSKCDRYISRSDFNNPDSATHTQLNTNFILGDDIVNDLKVTPPPYRSDITIVEDLIEEIARIYGYNKLPTLPIKTTCAVKTHKDKTLVSEREIKNLLAARGYTEAITYSFVSLSLEKMLNPNCTPIPLINPLSPEHAVMRTSLWTGLIGALMYNLKRQQTRVRLFETGLCFRHVTNKNATTKLGIKFEIVEEKEGDITQKTEQKPMVAGIVTGTTFAEHWSSKNSICDFYDIKSDIEYLLKSCSQNTSTLIFDIKDHMPPALHPKHSAVISLAERNLGYIGKLHPHIQQTLEIKEPVYLFELDIQSFFPKKTLNFMPISKFPAVERDISLIIDREIPWQRIKDKVQESGGELLRDIKIFDIYQVDGITNTQQSITLRLRFQHLSHTLVDNEIDNAIHKITTAIKRDLNAVLRG